MIKFVGSSLNSIIKTRPQIILSLRSVSSSELPFSKSAAYLGRDRGEYVDLSKPLYIPDYYDSKEYTDKRLFSLIFSIVAVGIYIGIFRKPNDLDEILDSPIELLAVNMERMALREKIRTAIQVGNRKDAAMYKAHLDYVDVKEAASKAKQVNVNKKSDVA